MSANPPFDLGSLADVDSPEVVREALRNFRRRTLRNSIWVLAVVAMLAIPITQQILHRDPQEAFDAAEGFSPGTVYTDRGITMILLRVADLGERTGLHVVVSADGLDTDLFTRPRIQNTYYPDSLEVASERVFEGWYAVSVPSDGKIRVELFVPDRYRARVFTIDLRAAGVPERLWQKEEVR